MDKISYKQEVLAAVKEKQQNLIQDFRTRIQDLEGIEVHMNEGQYDGTQHSHNTSSEELVEDLNGQLQMVEREMNILENIHLGSNLHDTVEVGSVVKTNHLTFFPSVSIEKFNVGSDELFGISTKAPIYSEMMDKKTGDQFEFNGKVYQIEEIF